MLCSQCQKNIGKELRERLTRVNHTLYSIGLAYHDTLGQAAQLINDALIETGFEPNAVPVVKLCEGEYRAHVEVGEGKWLTACFHEMPSGRFEVVAYVN